MVKKKTEERLTGDEWLTKMRTSNDGMVAVLNLLEFDHLEAYADNEIAVALVKRIEPIRFITIRRAKNNCKPFLVRIHLDYACNQPEPITKVVGDYRSLKRYLSKKSLEKIVLKLVAEVV